MNRLERLTGVLLGTAVGDSIGLPREGLGPRRALRLHGPPPLEQHLFLGFGLMSDDTEHACMTAQALLSSSLNADSFASSLAWRLRGWFLGLPAGIGLGTLRAMVKLWLGFPPARSGVRSAGNGPGMRAPIIGACLSGDAQRLEPVVLASTRLTHRDPKAEAGALAVALCAVAAVSSPPGGVNVKGLLRELGQRVPDPELHRALDLLEEHLARGASPSEYAHALGLSKGITGYIHHSVPASLYCWLRFPNDFRRAVEEVVLLGGDSDTTAALVGALAGGNLGVCAIPTTWLERLVEWPRSVGWMRGLAARLARQFPGGGAGDYAGPARLFWPALLVRNILFFALVLGLGLRRLLPPY